MKATFLQIGRTKAAQQTHIGVTQAHRFGPNTLEANNASSREVHFCQEFPEALIGVNGVESGVLSDPIQAASVPISLVQPLKCPILVPELRINAGDFIGTNVRTTGGVPSRCLTLTFPNLC